MNPTCCGCLKQTKQNASYDLKTAANVKLKEYVQQSLHINVSS